MVYMKPSMHFKFICILQACFVEHKTEIKNYLDSREEAKKMAYLQVFLYYLK